MKRRREQEQEEEKEEEEEEGGEEVQKSGTGATPTSRHGSDVHEPRGDA